MTANKEFIPNKEGYRFPAEWETHSSTWLSYPHNENSWPGKIHTIFPFYQQFILEISKKEKVNINVQDDQMKQQITQELMAAGADLQTIELHVHPTNDAWCRDHGPCFLKHNNNKQKIIVNWKYNAWGNKYPYEQDTVIPTLVGKKLGLPVVYPGIVMEGGSIDVNGAGTLLTTTSCLLHENRNPNLTRQEIEQKLMDYYCVDKILWLADGIEGDDTNGHIDDITRFVNKDTVITMIEKNTHDANHEPLAYNLELLKKMRLQDGKQLNIVEIPMPDPLYYEGQRLPASYANFYICNAAVIVPVFNCKQDQEAIDRLSECFNDRAIIGIDSTEIIWGLGSWHCLSQQEC